jgi:hypothetical protein
MRVMVTKFTHQIHITEVRLGVKFGWFTNELVRGLSVPKFVCANLRVPLFFLSRCGHGAASGTLYERKVMSLCLMIDTCRCSAYSVVKDQDGEQ